jgi:hypothetical protein
MYSPFPSFSLSSLFLFLLVLLIDLFSFQLTTQALSTQRWEIEIIKLQIIMKIITKVFPLSLSFSLSVSLFSDPSPLGKKFNKCYMLARELGSGAFSVVKLGVNKVCPLSTPLRSSLLMASLVG